MSTNIVRFSNLDDGIRYGALWSPSSISTEAWFDAADLTTISESSGSVSQWRDKSGNDQHFVQETVLSQPSTGASINGVAALNFDDDHMIISSMSLPTSGNMAMHIVWYPIYPNTINNDFLFGTNATNYIRGQYKDIIPAELRYQGVMTAMNYTSDQNSGSALNVGVWNFTAGTGQAYYDGTFISEDLAYSTKFDTGVDFYLGTDSDTTLFVTADIGEIIFTEDITDATRQRIEGYLAWKWGMSQNLPSNHPYKSAPPPYGD